jgi:uncharacterized protein (TIGR02246 family)
VSRSFAFAAFVVVVLLSSGCEEAPARPPDHRVEEVRRIRDLETAWNRDYSRNDVEMLLSHYSQDATMMIPHIPSAVGLEAIRTVLKQAVEDGNFQMRLEGLQVEVSREGDLAYSHGSYTTRKTDPVSGQALNEKGSYVIVYRKADRSWKAVADIRTPNE